MADVGYEATLTATSAATEQIKQAMKKRKIEATGAGFGNGFNVEPTAITAAMVMERIRDVLYDVETAMMRDLDYAGWLPYAYTAYDEDKQMFRFHPTLSRSGKKTKRVDNPAHNAWMQDRAVQERTLPKAQYDQWLEANPEPPKQLETPNPNYGLCFFSTSDSDMANKTLSVGFSCRKSIDSPETFVPLKYAQRKGKDGKVTYSTFVWFHQLPEVKSGVFSKWFPMLDWMTANGDSKKFQTEEEAEIPRVFFDVYYNDRKKLFHDLWTGLINAHMQQLDKEA